MANSQAATVKSPAARVIQEVKDLVDLKNFLAGYISDLDPAQIPDAGLTYALNVEYLRGMLFRRNGLLTYSNTKPNSNKVLNIAAFYQTTTGLNLIRLDRQKIERSQSSGWTEFTPNPVGVALAGSDYDYFSITSIDDRAFFSNNGHDPIREMTPGTSQYQALGNAPQYKYITAAFDRIVGVNRVAATDIPTEVGWSGSLNYDEWDPLVDISAGTNNLVASPSAVSDDITGIFFNDSALIVPRQRSIWLGTHLDSGTNPFNFFSKVPRVGADLPRTIKLTEYGLVWASFQASCIYVWDLQSNTPIKLTTGKISRYLKVQIQAATEIWGAFSYDTNKYSLFMSNISTSTVTCITFDFVYQNYVIHEYPMVSAVEDLDFAASSTTIDELVGTIAGLVGTIDALGGLIANTTRFFGRTDGEMATYSFYSGLESTSLITATDLGTAFTNDIRSKIFEIPPDYQTINLVRFPYTPYSTGTLNLYYSKDDGLTWILAKTEVVVTGDLSKGNILQLKKAVLARRIIWRLTSADCMMAHNGLYVQVLKSGEAPNGS